MENLPASIAGGEAVAARVGRAQALSGLGIDADGFDLADPHALRVDGVAAAFGVFCYCVRKAWLDEHFIRQPLLMEAWGVDGCLRVHTESHPIQNRKQRC